VLLAICAGTVGATGYLEAPDGTAALATPNPDQRGRVSNQDSPGPYWQEPSGAGRHGARSAPGGEDPYGRDGRYGRPSGRGYGPPAGNGSNGNGSNGYGPNGYGRQTGNGRPNGNGSGGGSNGYGQSGGAGYPPGYGNGQRRSDGNGRPREDRAPDRSGRPSGGGGYPGGDGYSRHGGRGQDPDDSRGAAGGRGRAAGARARGAQIGNDLRSRLGLGSGAPAQGGPPPRGTRGAGADAELRARLGLRARPGAGAGQSYAGPGGAGRYPDGYDGNDGDVIDYGTPAGSRGATALRERGTGRFTTERRDGGFDNGGSGGGWDGGPRQRRKGDWWRHWTWRKALLWAVGAGVGMVLLLVAAVVYMYQNTPIPTDVSEAALQQSSTVYFSNGKTAVGTFTADGIDRQMLTTNQIPAVMKNAIVAAEDRHFYSEGGISVSGIVRSAYEDIKGGGNLQGGSTLTEEFAKNYYTTIGTSRTMSTKIKEIFVSIKLSHEKSKDWIITQYLNTVPFGNNAYGVAAASQLYFGEPAMKLTAAQSAMLAALVNEPSFFTPDPSGGAGYTALVARWHYVLTNMVRDGALTQQQAAEQTFPKVLTNNALTTSWTGYKGYIMQQVENELKYTYGYSLTDIDTKGLKIVTTFNLGMMRALYQAVNQNVAQMRQDGSPLPWYAHVGAVLEKPGTGAILAMYGGPNYAAKNCARIFCQLNMATENREQVGSSFKPYVLSTAVSEGMDVQNSILNAIEPMCIPPDSTPQTRSELSQPTTNCPSPGFEVNIGGENSGPLSVAKAAAISSDPAFEDLIHRAGTQATVNMAKAFGVNTIAAGLQKTAHSSGEVGEVGMALGISSLTVEEQATTFATLADGGEYVTPHVIAQISENGNNIPLKITRRQVLTPAQAADVDYALSFDVNCASGACGTAVPNGQLSPARPTIGKTGTTDDEKSAFFLGAIPQYSLAVGMFTNQQNGLHQGQTLSNLASVNGQPAGDGGNWPAAIWQSFMQPEFGNLPIEPLATPDYVGFTKWDQVPTQPKKPKKHQNPGNPLCPPGHHHFGACPQPTQPANPFPTSPVPTPSPTPTPTPTPTVSPFGGGTGGGADAGALTTNAAGAVPLQLVAEDPTAQQPGSG
jgi:membrane peptidoglycan carboxypeptidase